MVVGLVIVLVGEWQFIFCIEFVYIEIDKRIFYPSLDIYDMIIDLKVKLMVLSIIQGNKSLPFTRWKGYIGYACVGIYTL